MLRPRVKRLFRLAVRRRDLLREDIDDEIRFHLEARAAQLVRRGLSPEAARAEAERRFGSPEDVHEHLLHSARRREGRMQLHETLAGLTRDLRYALRGLRRQPGFVAGVILTLALGIGANVTMFGIVDRLLLRPPALMAHPETVGRVYLYDTYDGKEGAGGSFGYRRFLDLRENTRSFSQMALFADRDFVFGTGQTARRQRVSLVSASLWPLFGVRPALGRFFVEAEDRPPAGTPVVVLGHGYWQTEFGGAQSVLGRRIRIGGEDYSVIGVAPPGFTGMGMSRVAAFIPVTAGGADMFADRRIGSEPWYDTYNMIWAQVVARRRPGVTLAQANADLSAAYVRSRQADIAARPDRGLSIEQLKPHASLESVIAQRGPQRGASARVATWLAGVSALVLLMACANVANLLLARSAQQRRETAVRIALGVTRARLLAQHFAESVLLALAGGLAGLLVATWGGGVIRATLLPDVDWTTTVLDTRLLAFTIAAALLTGALTGLAPALHGRRADVSAALKAGGREGSLHRSRLRATLLVVQAAVSVVLLVGAGLFVRSLQRVNALDLGYDPDRVVWVSLDMRSVKNDSAAQARLLDALLARARAHPDVEQAALTMTVPFAFTWNGGIAVPGKDSSALRGDWLMNTVSPGYFETMGTRLVRGRGIEAGDRLGAERVAVLSQSAAQAIWPGQEPLGRCVKLEADTMPCNTVVGIVHDIQRDFEGVPGRHIYLALAQDAGPQTSLLVRTRGDAIRTQEGIRRALQGAMPGDSYLNAESLAEIAAPQLRPWKLGATMFTLFGVLAVVVAAVGLYSVVSYGVTQRSHEIGVRIALGARADDVVRLVLGEGVRTTVIGVALGAAGALLAGRWVASLLFQTSPRDPVTFAGVVTVLLLVAVAASFAPALRAARVDPNVALRSD